MRPDLGVKVVSFGFPLWIVHLTVAAGGWWKRELEQEKQLYRKPGCSNFCGWV